MHAKRLVIDPGHGGEEAPGVTYKGLREADANLATALTLKYVLTHEMAAPFDIILTRTKDTFVRFAQRTGIQGDLFVAIHHDIVGGAAPIYHQRRCNESAYVAWYLHYHGLGKHPVWPTTRARFTRLYIDDVRYPAVLVEMDTIDQYREDKEYRLKAVRPLAKAILDVMSVIQ